MVYGKFRRHNHSHTWNDCQLDLFLKVPVHQQLRHIWSLIIPMYDMDLVSSPRTSQSSQFSMQCTVPQPSACSAQSHKSCNIFSNFTAGTTILPPVIHHHWTKTTCGHFIWELTPFPHTYKASQKASRIILATLFHPFHSISMPMHLYIRFTFSIYPYNGARGGGGSEQGGDGRSRPRPGGTRTSRRPLAMQSQQREGACQREQGQGSEEADFCKEDPAPAAAGTAPAARDRTRSGPAARRGVRAQQP